jgi:uncharacterized protein YciI
MYLIELTYKKDLTVVDQFLKELVEFLDANYAKGNLIFSGRKNPRDGGIMLSSLESRQLVEAMITQDPFLREEIAIYRIVEFTPTKFDKRFECYVK